jgi:hypothetical protein
MCFEGAIFAWKNFFPLSFLTEKKLKFVFAAGDLAWAIEVAIILRTS